jgi:hypothetical protein
VTDGLITEPIRFPFDLPVPINIGTRKRKLNSLDNREKVQLGKVEIRDQIKRCIDTENLTLQQTSERVGISVITVRRISRTLKVGPYREIDPTAIRPKSSQTPYGWSRINGTLEQYPSEWKWVVVMFKLHSEGISLHKTAAHLNALNVTSKNGRSWSAKTISQTLKWNEPHLKQPCQRR